MVLFNKEFPLFLNQRHIMDPFWNKSANYGRIDILPDNGDVKLYYNQFEYKLLMYPRYFKASSAMWQGNHAIVRGYNQFNGLQTVVMTDFFSFQPM